LNRGGYIIGIEGMDAVGKHTQSLLLETWLRKNGLETVTLSFPDYETPIGREIRAFLSGERAFLPELRHMLFAANRWEKVPLINGYRKANKTIIVNRYSESNLVYGVANGLRLEWLMSLEEGVPKPDLVVVLDAPRAGLLSRRPGTKDTYENDSELQTRVQRLYRELATKFGWVVVDAGGEIESVHESLVEVVKERMNLGRREQLRHSDT
jgi:dTMP kinase